MDIFGLRIRLLNSWFESENEFIEVKADKSSAENKIDFFMNNLIVVKNKISRCKYK